MNTLDILLTGSLVFNLLLLVRILKLKRNVRGVRESARLSKDELEHFKARIGKIKKFS